MKNNSILKTLSLLVFSFVAVNANAARVLESTPQILIDTEGDSLLLNKNYFALDTKGKRKAIVKIIDLNGSTAKAKLMKGKLEKGFSIQINTEKNQTQKSSSHSSSESTSSWAVMGGISMDSMNVKLTTATTVAMTGMGYNLSFIYKKFLTESFSFSAEGMYDQLMVTGTNSLSTCNGSRNCNVQISYLMGNAAVQWNFKFTPTFSSWVGGGFGVGYPMANSTNILSSSSISTTYSIILQLGSSWKMSSGFFIPFGIDYFLLPSSDVVSVNQILIRAGVGNSF